ncbi:MAG TPA: hypothetical protein VI636_14020 [Candidatus Angelobacter sp.]
MASPIAGITATSAPISAAIFQQDRFMARQRIFTLTPQFHFYDLSGNTLAFLRKKVFTWKDEIRIFTDQAQSMELLHIKARKIIDWGTAFDITDSINHQKVGVLKRQGWKSLVRKEWTIMDANDQEIGRIQEDSMFLATVRRYLTNIIPQSYTFAVRGQLVGTARQNWNFFAPKMEVDFSGDPGRMLDRRLVAAAIVLLMAVEGRQGAYD